MFYGCVLQRPLETAVDAGPLRGPAVLPRGAAVKILINAAASVYGTGTERRGTGSGPLVHEKSREPGSSVAPEILRGLHGVLRTLAIRRWFRS